MPRSICCLSLASGTFFSFPSETRAAAEVQPEVRPQPCSSPDGSLSDPERSLQGAHSQFRAVACQQTRSPWPRLSEKRDMPRLCVGKWHLGWQRKYLPGSHGFDQYYGVPYSNDMSPGTQPGNPVFKDSPPTPVIRNFTVMNPDSEPYQSLLTRRYTQESLAFIRRHAVATPAGTRGRSCITTSGMSCGV